MIMMMMMMQDIQHVHVSWYVQHFLHMMGFNFMSLSAAFLAESERFAQTASTEDVVVSCSRFFFKRQRWIIHQERCSSKQLQELVSKNKRREMIYSIFFVARDTSCRSLCKVVFEPWNVQQGLETCQKNCGFFSPYSKRGKPQTWRP